MTEAGFRVERLEYYDAAGHFHQTAWDPADGMVHRSLEYDERNVDGIIGYTSLILDGFKP
jgi:predicted SAM-dependent methyltransferase